MPKSQKGQGESNDFIKVLKDILITQLGMAGVPQLRIREIVGGDIGRVNRIVKHLKNARRGREDR
jgi:hypothetical protein